MFMDGTADTTGHGLWIFHSVNGNPNSSPHTQVRVNTNNHGQGELEFCLFKENHSSKSPI